MRPNLYVLNFESGLWLHAATEAKIAQQAALAGWDVKTINCDGFFVGYCSVRSSRQRNIEQIEKRVDCADCQFTNKATSKINLRRNVDNLQIGSYLKSSHVTQIQELISEARGMTDPLQFEYEGIKFGRMASHETILRFKLIDPKISDEARHDYFLQLEDCLRVFFSFSSMLESTPNRSSFLVRNLNYSVHRVIAILATRSGHEVFGMRSSANLSSAYTKMRLFQFEESTTASTLELAAFRASKIDFNSIPTVRREIQKHLKILKLGRSWMVYSRKSKGLEAGDIRKRLGVPSGKKVVLMALSSTDEMNAFGTAYQESSYPGGVFPSQREMVDTAIEWARNQSDIFLVIRPHPRENPHGRNTVKSAMTSVWAEVLQKLPTNVVADDVEQGNSLYDVMNVTDVVVTGWSTVGLEASAFGKTVVLYDKALPQYPYEIGLTGESKEEFLSNLDLSLILNEDEKQRHRQIGLDWLSFLEESYIKVPSRFLSESFATSPKFLQRAINAIDRFIPITRVLDLYLFRRKSDLEPLWRALTSDTHGDQRRLR